MGSNKKKSEQLGMPHGTAAHRLRKMVLFHEVKRQARNKCFRCAQWIVSPDELSIEHVKPWLDSEDPTGLYFDLGNITFSHLSCNSGAARHKKAPHGSHNTYQNHGCRCVKCTKANTDHVRKNRALSASG